VKGCIFGIGAFVAELLADDSMRRKSRCDQPAHGELGGAVGLGDGIEAAAARFVVGADRTAEERQDCLARECGEPVDEFGEIDWLHEFAGSRAAFEGSSLSNEIVDQASYPPVRRACHLGRGITQSGSGPDGWSGSRA
jgi:hypothetical protein